MDGVEFTSELDLADIDCFTDKDPNFNLIYPETTFTTLQDHWATLIKNKICDNKSINWSDFISLND